MGHTMRTDRYRYAEWYPWEDGRTTPIRFGEEEPAGIELYDHATDPQENRNVAAAPENQELVPELGKRLAHGWEESFPPDSGH